MPSWKLVAAWVAVVAATTLLAWQIVSLADSQVSATPVQILTPTTTTVPGSSTSSSAVTSSTSTSVTNTTGDTSPSPTVTSSTSATSPTTPEWSVRTVNSPGGTVIVRHRPGEVELQAATPLPGFVMEIDDNGPDRVRVEFENDEESFRVEVRWEGGLLDIGLSG